MANRAYLLNTPNRVSDIAALSGEWLTVAEGRYCIPLAWLCMFGDADLRPCTIVFNSSEMVEGESRALLGKFAILNPSTSVAAARGNLARARPVFEELVGDTAAAAHHWQAAMDMLDVLPHAFLTIDPTDILLMDDLKSGAMKFAAAFSNDVKGMDAKRHLVGTGDGPDARMFHMGFTGGFNSPGSFDTNRRTAEATKAQLEQLALLDTCNLAEVRGGYEKLPLDLESLNPPPAFWQHTALVDSGAQQIKVNHGTPVEKDGKKFYATSLTNISGKKVRVMMFGGFSKREGSYALTNYTNEWFSASDFIKWYGAANDGWIQPGQTVADNSNWGGDDDGFWAYWCKNEDGERFPAMATFPQWPDVSTSTDSSPDPWAPFPDGYRVVIAKNSEIAQKLLRDYAKQDVSFDLKGVEWLDEVLEALRRSPSEAPQAHRLVPGFGAFLGECIVRNIGGEWALYDGTPCIRFDDDNAAFPLVKSAKQLENGREGGDSVLGMYQVTMSLTPTALTDRQRRFLKLYRERRHYQFFVLHRSDSTLEWARVKNISGLWISIETTLTEGLKTKPEVSVRLDQITGFCVMEANNAVVESEGYPGAATPPVSVFNEARVTRSWLGSPMPPDATKEHAIKRLRSVYSETQKMLNPRSFESIRVSAPSWLQPGIALHETITQQFLLATQGTVVWAALVQANTLLFKPGDVDCPATLIYSRDPYFDAQPDELRAVARRIFELKETKPRDPDERALADRITNEMDLFMGWRLPEALTDKVVHATTFMVFRKHIPGGVLSASSFPILIHPSTQAVMIVPVEFWPIELIVLWKEGKL